VRPQQASAVKETTMRAIRLVSAVAALAVGLATNAVAAEAVPKPGDAAPDFTVKMVTGDASSIKLSDLRGKYVLVVMMTKDCPACKQDIPTINEGYKRLGGERFTVVGVVDGADRADVRELIRATFIEFPVGHDERRKVCKSYGVDVVPTSFLIDPDGAVVSSSHGTAPQFEEVQKRLEADAARAPSDETAGGQTEPVEQHPWLQEAYAYYERGELAKAYECCCRAIEADPDNVRAHVLLGDVYAKAGKVEKAVEAYRGALQRIDPEDFGAISAGYKRITGIYLASKDYGHAAGVDAEALTTIYAAEYKLAFFAELGACQANLGDRVKALASYEKFVSTYKTVDTRVQKQYAEMYKWVLAQEQQLKESGEGSADKPSPRSN
jgi:peroxiredoxin/Tfp pilus assembly protein PilF